LLVGEQSAYGGVRRRAHRSATGRAEPPPSRTGGHAAAAGVAKMMASGSTEC